MNYEHSLAMGRIAFWDLLAKRKICPQLALGGCSSQRVLY